VYSFIGTHIKHADEQRYKEERKVIAGYASGRRAPEVVATKNILCIGIIYLTY
jgi:hypothetical protein